MKERTVKNWHKHCLLPDGTELQEHSIKTDRNIVVGEFCQIDYGLRGADIYVGESSKIREYVWASGDARIGNWCEIGNDVIAKGDAYIGEGVKINGKLSVNGALDIGEKVEIKEGFEAKGDIEVRNPMPVFMFILIYFTEGVVRGYSDKLPLSSFLGWGEAAIVCVYFLCSVLYLRPYKKAAKRMAKELLDKVNPAKSTSPP